MRYDFKRRTGKRGVIDIPNEQITGDRKEFVAKNVTWWAKAKGVPEADMVEMLGKMWDAVNPAKTTKPEAVKNKAE